MTVSRPRQDTPRLRPPSPRGGFYRRRGGAASNPVAASGATAWFDAHDGSGLQQVPSRIGTGVITLGSTTGVDTNDPTWGSSPYAWSVDATDDYMDTSGTGMAPTFTSTTGAYAAMFMVTAPGATNRLLWSSGSASNRNCYLGTFSTTSIRVIWNGSVSAVAGTAMAYTTAGNRKIIGFTISSGVAAPFVYDEVGETITVGTTMNVTAAGDFTHTNPRYGAASWTTSFSWGANIQTMVEWNGTAPGTTTLATVGAYLWSLF